MAESTSREIRAQQAEAVGRMLRGAGPRITATLQALLAGEPTPVQTGAVLQTAQVVENALQSGARQAAWLLYEGARACLEFDPEYRVRTDRSTGLQVRAWSELEGRATALKRRLETAGAGRHLRWPSGRPSDAETGQRLARECMALAEDVFPGWGWTSFELSCIELQAERWDVAQQLLADLSNRRVDPVLRNAVARNHCSALLMAGRAEELERPLRQLEQLSGVDLASTYFLMEWSAARADTRMFDQAKERFADQLDGQRASYWVPYLKTRADLMAARMPGAIQTIQEWIMELPS